MDEQIPSYFDVSKLSSSSRRKYQSYFGLNCDDSELSRKIKQHFDNELKVQANQVIQKFLQLKKQDKEKRRQRNARTPLNA